MFLTGIARSAILKEVNLLPSLLSSVHAESDIEYWPSNDEQRHSYSLDMV